MTYAEKVNYWQTSKSSADTWIKRAVAEIAKVGGTIIGEVFMSDPVHGKAVFVLAFDLEGDRFKMTWPVLESKSGNTAAAKKQAATALCHEVKAACVRMKFLGARTAFFPHIMLKDGRVAAELAVPELAAMVPALIEAPSGSEYSE